MKKIFLNFILITVSMFVLFACGSTEEVSNDNSGESNNAGKDEQSVESNDPIELSVGVVVGDWSPHYKGVAAWSDGMEEKSNGKIKVTIFPDGQLGGEREMLEAVQNGNLDLGLISSAVYAAFDPRLSVVDIPYLVSTFDEAEALMDSEVGERLDEVFLEIGLRNLAWAHNDFRIITNNEGPIHSPEDLAGIKMRVPESRVLTDWFQSLGSQPTPLPTPEVYTALQQGVVDAQENGAVLTFAAKYYEHQKYLTITNHQYSPVGLFVSEKVWGTLSEDIQQIITEAAKEAAVVERKAIRDFNEVSVNGMEESGLEVNYLTEDEVENFRETALPMIDTIRDIAGDELTDFVIEKANK